MTPNDVILTSFDPVSIAFLEYWVWSFILLIAAPWVKTFSNYRTKRCCCLKFENLAVQTTDNRQRLEAQQTANQYLS
jgi:hypothetical protein